MKKTVEKEIEVCGGCDQENPSDIGVCDKCHGELCQACSVGIRMKLSGNKKLRKQYHARNCWNNLEKQLPKPDKKGK